MALDELDAYQARALAALADATDADALEEWYRTHLAPSGQANAYKRLIGKQPKDLRRAFGQAINAVGKALGAAFEEAREGAKARALAARLSSERVDVTLPARPRRKGGLHPSVIALREVIDIFAQLGFSAAPLCSFLAQVQQHPHPEYFSAELRAKTIQEGFGAGARRQRNVRKFFPELARMTSAAMDLGDG